jgi:hypothetical protein
MNKRILELADKAGADIWDDQASACRHFSIEKFAELIIRECMKVAVFKDDGYISTADVAGYMAAGRSTAAKMIKEHFGVEP